MYVCICVCVLHACTTQIFKKKKIMHICQTQVADPSWMLDKQHADAVMNFLLRLACQVTTHHYNPNYSTTSH